MSPLFKHHISGQVATTSQQKSFLPGLFPEHVASVNTLTFCTVLNHPSVSVAANSDVTPPTSPSKTKSFFEVITVGIKFHPLNELQS